jgi:predicted DNA-binding transcriptional regulator AlpA
MTDLAERFEQADPVLIGSTKLSRPVPVRDRWGRYKRDPGGEWDWFYDLPADERAYISRAHMTATGLHPDELATWLATDTDTAMNRWVLAARRARAHADTLADDYDTSCVDDNELLGPDEVADLLCVQRNTLAQWRKRGQLPEPYKVLSSLPIWRRCDVIEWAQLTNRRIEGI